ncbi:excinuclease ATPase subunit [Chitinivorax sp. B]|uniref:excinuclease ATPase subunit n=1 Tax=Chitinivorax sp. B TaxID=2502235 RepID=UPI0010F6B69F|nr:excinuclease ATPase subunit [Chitinivorax sp. B]
MKISTALLAASLLSVTSFSYARDDALHLPIEAAMNSQNFKDKLDGSVKFYWGKQKSPKVVEEFAVDISNRKTNSVGKTPEEACQWALLAALQAFQDKAKTLGANAVINVVSYYKKNEFSSTNEYECHDGSIMSGVAIRGKLVKVAS